MTHTIIDIFKNYTASTLFALLLSSAAAPAYADSSKVLKMVTLHSSPLAFIEGNKTKGINVEIVRETCRLMGYDLEVLFVPWARALLMVKEGKADAIINAAYNKERAEYLVYPEHNIYEEQVVAYKLRSRDIELDANLSDAEKYKVGIARGHYYGEKIQDALEKGVFQHVDVLSHLKDNSPTLMFEQIDMIIAVRLPMDYVIKEYDFRELVDIVNEKGTSKPLILGRSKTYCAFSEKRWGRKMAGKFDEALQKILKDGTVADITNRYQ